MPSASPAPSPRPRAWLLIGALAVVLGAALPTKAATSGRDAVVPTADAPILRADVAPRIVDLIADVGFEKALPGGLAWSSITVERHRVVFSLTRLGETSPVATLTLTPNALEPVESSRLEANINIKNSVSFAIKWNVNNTDQTGVAATSDEIVREACEAAAASIRKHDTGGFWQRTEHSVVDKPRIAPRTRILIFCGLVLLLLAAVAWRMRTGTLDDSEVYLKPTHFLPFAVQLVLFAYWALYWRELPSYLPQIALQIGFAYVLDAALGMIKDGRYRLTAGPLPIVGSINLFVQFPASEWPMQYGIIALAILSKSLLTHRGRHLLNPSGFGIAVVGLLNLAFPQLGNGDIAHAFDLPPNMAEVVVLIAIVVQTRVPVVLVSLAAACGLLLHSWASPDLNFSPLWSPVTLVVVLLATDPATSPRTALGRAVYGLTFGVLMGLAGQLLTAMGHQDFYAKILPLPLCNLLVPQFDALATKLEAAAPRLFGGLQPRRNLLHVGLFVALMTVGLLSRGKPAAFEGIAHRYNGTRFVNWRSDGRATCSKNSLFCDGFTLGSELRCWVARFGPVEDRCGSGTARFEHRNHAR